MCAIAIDSDSVSAIADDSSSSGPGSLHEVWPEQAVQHGSLLGKVMSENNVCFTDACVVVG